MCRMNFLMLGAAFLVGSVFMFWNLENCFDPYDDPLTRDEEFTPGGARHWTWKRVDRKLTGVAKVILAARDSYGDYPALVGFCEVENATVVRRLASHKLLASLEYDWIHRDSPDGRGIDVALLFRRDKFRPLVVHAVPVPTDPPTRDILYVKGLLEGDTVHVLVNHWPSKLGGRAGGARREAAAAALRACVDSIDAPARQPILICGDFNATPAEIDLDIPGLENLAAPLAAAGEGSLKYRGTWELIDQFWVRLGAGSTRPAWQVSQKEGDLPRKPRENVAGGTQNGTPATPRMEVFRLPFLLEPDTGYIGERPRRTWSGPHYKGGLSDHLPVVLLL